MPPIQSQPSQSASAQPSYAGWEYQILVSVWMTLEFILLKGSEEIIIEPASHEDIEASYEVQREVTTVVRTDRFNIQVKLRNGVVWSRAMFEALLPDKPATGSRGPKPRPRPLSHLKADSSLRFVLITNTLADRELRDFVIKQIGEDSTASSFSDMVVDPEVVKRVGILEGRNEEYLLLKIGELLQAICHVPHQRLTTCIKSLKDAVRTRLLGQDPNSLARDVVQGIIVNSGGSFEPRRPPIAPSNLDGLISHLEKEKAIVLIGPPGTGKTEIALFLAHSLALGEPPAHFEPVKKEDLATVRKSLQEHGSTVYYLEDPWGQGPPDSGADAITSELSKLLPMAKAGKHFVITSTSGAFEEANADDPKRFRRWVQRLDPEHYDGPALDALYERGIEKWSEEFRDRAVCLKNVALPKLETPFAIVRFCGHLEEALREGTVTESEARSLAVESNVGAVTEKLTKRIERGGNEHIKAAIMIWALLTVKRNFVDVETIARLRKFLKDAGVQNPPDLEFYFKQLATSWLQKRVSGFLATPTVRKALGTFAERRQGMFSDTMEELATGWGNAGEYEAIQRCVEEILSTEFIPQKFRPAYDLFLIERTKTMEGYRFRHGLRELAQFTFGRLPAWHLAQILTARAAPTRKTWYPGHREYWIVPALSDPEILAISECADCRLLGQRFVSDILLHESGTSFSDYVYDPQELAKLLTKFGWPIVTWLESTFRTSLDDPEDGTPYLLEVLFAVSTESIDAILDDCLHAIRIFSEPSPVNPSVVESRRQEEQGETDCPLDHDAEDPNWSRLHNVEQALRIALKTKRASQGYTWILDHPRLADLLPVWTKVLCNENEPDLEECKAAVESCTLKGLHERAADVVRVTFGPTFREWAVARLLGTEGEIPPATLAVLLGFSHDQEFLECLRQSAANQFRPMLALLAFSAARQSAGRKPGEVAAEFSFAKFPELADFLTEREQASIVACCLAAEGGPNCTPCADQSPEFLKHLIAHWPLHYAIYAAQAYSRCAADPLSKLADFLASSDTKIRQKAWSLCSSVGELEVKGLDDDDCYCRIAAAERLASLIPHDRWNILFALGEDRSAFVRKAIARLIGNHRIATGLDCLMGLLTDTRDYGWQRDEEERGIFEVARTAAHSIAELGLAAEPALPSIRDFLEGCEKSTSDPVVHSRLFVVLSGFAEEESIRFCDRYLNTIWLQSEWRHKSGHNLLEHCVDAAICILDRTPRLANLLDLSEISVAATWRKDDAWLVAPVTAAIGLALDANDLDLRMIVPSPDFSRSRACLLALLSPSLRTNPDVLGERLSNENSFVDFLRWVDLEAGSDYQTFITSFPDFLSWFNGLDSKDRIEKYLRWAVVRLILARDHGEPLALEFPGFNGLGLATN